MLEPRQGKCGHDGDKEKERLDQGYISDYSSWFISRIL
jgi:hypothetical protein